MRYSELNEATVHGKTFYAACKKMFGGRAFDKGLTKDEIKAVEKSLDIDRLPSYLANAPTIDGHVVVIPPNHPDWKTRFGDKASAVKAQGATKPKEDLSPQALGDIMFMMKREWRGPNTQSFNWTDWRPVEKANNYWEFSVRDWGDWEIPPGEEDDGDYDWETLSDHSSIMLRNIVQTVAAKYPDLQIDYQTGEKNWIYITSRAKA